VVYTITNDCAAPGLAPWIIVLIVLIVILACVIVVIIIFVSPLRAKVLPYRDRPLFHLRQENSHIRTFSTPGKVN